MSHAAAVSRFHEQPRWWRAMRRATVALLLGLGALAAFSAYRAIVQVYRLELRVPSRLEAGTVVRADLLTSGRATTTLRVMLEQDGRVDTIGVMRLRGNRDGALDPRPRRGSLEVVIPARALTRFQPGRARVRAVAVGTSQWLRVPPPTVRVVESAIFGVPER